MDYDVFSGLVLVFGGALVEGFHISMIFMTPCFGVRTSFAFWVLFSVDLLW